MSALAGIATLIVEDEPLIALEGLLRQLDQADQKVWGWKRWLSRLHRHDS